MPNWCTNSLVAKKKVLRPLLTKDDEGNYNVDFNNLVPCPAILMKTISGGDSYWDSSTPEDPHARTEMTEADKKFLRDSFGATNWYDWCNNNWMTKWNAHDTYVEGFDYADDEEELCCDFETAWSPPMPVIEKLASMFPAETFSMEYYDEGGAFSCRSVFAHGSEESTVDIPWPYASDDEEESEVI